MTQRYCEVLIQDVNSAWVDVSVKDDAERCQMAHELSEKAKAGGKVVEISSMNETVCKVLVQWRSFENTVEVILEGLTQNVQSSSYRIKCEESRIVDQPSLICVDGQLHILFCSQFSVHVVCIDISNIERDGIVKSINSYPVSTSMQLIQCSADYKIEYGVVFSLINEAYQLFVININGGVYRETELKQASLMNKLWTNIRRSVAGSSDDSEQTVSTETLQEYQSTYTLTKNLHLKKWNTSSGECLSDWNLMTLTGRGSRACSVRLVGYDDSQALLGVLFNEGSLTKILLLELSGDGDIMNNSLVVDCQQNDVISFHVFSTTLFILCKDSNGLYSVQHMSLAASDGPLSTAYMEPHKPPEVELQAYEDPREAFCSVIFRHNSFNRTALCKSISLIDDELSSLSSCNEAYSLSDLERWTCDAINNEVRNLVYEEEVPTAEFRDLQIQAWNKFYSNLIQYQEVHTEPLGLVGGCDELPIALIRKSCVSYLRMCEPLELLANFSGELSHFGLPIHEQDVLTTMKTLNLLNTCLEGFEEHMYNAALFGQPLSDVLAEITESISGSESHNKLKTMFSSHIQNTHQLKEGIMSLLNVLNVVNSAAASGETVEAIRESNPFLAMNSTGIDLICTSVQGTVLCRFKLCCSLSVFLDYLIQFTEETGKLGGVGSDLEDTISSVHVLLKCYTVLLWITRLSIKPLDVDLSASMRESLRITNSQNMLTLLSYESGVSPSTTSALEGFLTGPGGCKVKALLPSDIDTENFNEYVNSLVQATLQALWPEVPDVMFGEFLLSRNESGSVHMYCRLLEDWCKLSTCPRLFLQGHSFIVEREPIKAYDCFQAALYSMFTAEGHSTEQQTDESIRQKQLELCYQVMNMYEEFSFSEQVVQMAYQTLRFTYDQQAKLWTKIFKHNLHLKRYDESFTAILSNTEKSSKLDCLSQFITTLCEDGKLSVLVSYPYKDLETQQDLRPAVVSILLSKARSVDLTYRNYYTVLYSFHVINQDLLSAANVMYECCERLSLEMSGLAALQAKAKCYLACITALQCVPDGSAWISVPTSRNHEDSEGRKSPKRTSRGASKSRGQVQVRMLTLDDIEKEYLLVNMSLRLANNGCKQITGSSVLDASDIVPLLCNVGMYDEAIEVCTTYKLSLNQVFDSLTFRCIRMGRDIANTDDAAITWLSYNKLPVDNSYTSFSDQAWRLLRSYLTMHTDVSSSYYKIVTAKLLFNNTAIPDWLIAEYKKKNVAELLRLYLQHDMIEEATELAVDLLDSITSASCEQFGQKAVLSATMLPQSVWCPYTSIDILLNALGEHRNDDYYRKMHDKLSAAVNSYMDHLKTACGDKIKQTVSSIHTPMLH